MVEPNSPLLGGVVDEIGSLGADLKQMLGLRWELAKLELQAALGQIKRLAVRLVMVGVMSLTGLPVLTVAAARLLDGWLGMPFSGWLLIVGLGLSIGGVTGGYLSWRSFRRRFVGIQQSIEELREDLVWLKEWSGSGQPDAKEERAADA